MQWISDTNHLGLAGAAPEAESAEVVVAVGVGAVVEVGVLAPPTIHFGFSLDVVVAVAAGFPYFGELEMGVGVILIGFCTVAVGASDVDAVDVVDAAGTVGEVGAAADVSEVDCKPS